MLADISAELASIERAAVMGTRGSGSTGRRPVPAAAAPVCPRGYAWLSISSADGP